MASKRSHEALSGGIFLIGLGLLFLLPGIDFWPWILLVIGAAGLPAALANDRGWVGWQGFLWMGGLAILFWSGYFWPGILILIGVNTLVGALTRESGGSPFAPSASPQGAGGAAKEDERVPFEVDDRHEGVEHGGEA